jgi:glycosyltransferase involved in cell wall biosynthesis
MSCQIPLIATNSSSIPELVGKYATLIEPKDVTELSNSITNIFNNYEKYKEIAVRGRVYTIDNFNWLKITEEYENIIYKTIKKFKNADL